MLFATWSVVLSESCVVPIDAIDLLLISTGGFLCVLSHFIDYW